MNNLSRISSSYLFSSTKRSLLAWSVSKQWSIGRNFAQSTVRRKAVENWSRPNISEIGVPTEPWAQVYARNQKRFNLQFIGGAASLLVSLLVFFTNVNLNPAPKFVYKTKYSTSLPSKSTEVDSTAASQEVANQEATASTSETTEDEESSPPLAEEASAKPSEEVSTTKSEEPPVQLSEEVSASPSSKQSEEALANAADETASSPKKPSPEVSDLIPSASKAVQQPIIEEVLVTKKDSTPNGTEKESESPKETSVVAEVPDVSSVTAEISPDEKESVTTEPAEPASEVKGAEPLKEPALLGTEEEKKDQPSVIGSAASSIPEIVEKSIIEAAEVVKTAAEFVKEEITATEGVLDDVKKVADDVEKVTNTVEKIVKDGSELVSEVMETVSDAEKVAGDFKKVQETVLEDIAKKVAEQK